MKRKILTLYRDLLRTVRIFPSKKRVSIREDIRVTFRERSTLKDEGELASAWEIGIRGLETMQKYTSLDKRATSWSVTLDQSPLGNGSNKLEAQFTVEEGSTVKKLA